MISEMQLDTRLQAWPDESACATAASALASGLSTGIASAPNASAYIELHGPLGAGKTTFARHLLHALGVAGTIKSPTYALLEPYRADAAHGEVQIAHCDFYRFDDPQEWEDAGFRDVFAAPGLKLVEWPEKAASLLPPFDLRVWIDPNDRDDSRRVRYEAATATGRALLPP